MQDEVEEPVDGIEGSAESVESPVADRSIPSRFRSLRDARGRFWCPWLPREDQVHTAFDMVRWSWQRFRHGVPPDPEPGSIPVLPGDLSTLGAEDYVLWVGHSTVLVRVGGVTILTDPVWSERVSPVRWAGPRRFQSPGLAFDRLPPLDVVLISHDHFDHLDRRTVRALARGQGGSARWFAPLGHERWLRRQGVRRVTEMDWWEVGEVHGMGEGGITLTAVPAQHWTRRTAFSTNARLWCGFVLDVAAPSGRRRIYFPGDSGYFGGFEIIGSRLGPFDLTLMPIGAYEPRWFMRFAHMNPEEAVRAYRDTGAEGLMVTTHWGTFRLTDEAPLEPPVRARQAWTDADLPPENLKILRHGEAVLF
jgi:L-ascorbate metabolism protein UlaG (beta-lactamase superfamily)